MNYNLIFCSAASIHHRGDTEAALQHFSGFRRAGNNWHTRRICSCCWDRRWCHCQQNSDIRPRSRRLQLCSAQGQRVPRLSHRTRPFQITAGPPPPTQWQTPRRPCRTRSRGSRIENGAPTQRADRNQPVAVTPREYWQPSERAPIYRPRPACMRRTPWASCRPAMRRSSSDIRGRPGP